MSRRTRHEIAELEWRLERDLAETVPCAEPGCDAPIGAQCQNTANGHPLENQPAHWRRIRDARTPIEPPPTGHPPERAHEENPCSAP